MRQRTLVPIHFIVEGKHGNEKALHQVKDMEDADKISDVI